MAELKEARVPDIGGHGDVPVIELLVKPGDTVEKVTSDTVLTAVWKENASEHKVEFYHNFPDGSDETLFTTVHTADGEGADAARMFSAQFGSGQGLKRKAVETIAELTAA